MIEKLTARAGSRNTDDEARSSGRSSYTAPRNSTRPRSSAGTRACRPSRIGPSPAINSRTSGNEGAIRLNASIATSGPLRASSRPR